MGVIDWHLENLRVDPDFGGLRWEGGVVNQCDDYTGRNIAANCMSVLKLEWFRIKENCDGKADGILDF